MFCFFLPLVFGVCICWGDGIEGRVHLLPFKLLRFQHLFILKRRLVIFVVIKVFIFIAKSISQIRWVLFRSAFEFCFHYITLLTLNWSFISLIYQSIYHQKCYSSPYSNGASKSFDQWWFHIHNNWNTLQLFYSYAARNWGLCENTGILRHYEIVMHVTICRRRSNFHVQTWFSVWRKSPSNCMCIKQLNRQSIKSLKLNEAARNYVVASKTEERHGFGRLRIIILNEIHG